MKKSKIILSDYKRQEENVQYKEDIKCNINTPKQEDNENIIASNSIS